MRFFFRIAQRNRPQVSDPSTITFLDFPGLSESRRSFAKDPYSLPAVSQGVHLIASEIAGLPLQVFDGPMDDVDNPVRDNDPLLRLLNVRWNVNEDAWRAKARVVKTVIDQGRCLIFIRRNERGRPVELFPLDPEHVTQLVADDGLTIQYEWTGGGMEGIIPPDDLVVVEYLPQANGRDVVKPLMSVADSINAALAAQSYAEHQFANAGIAPFALIAKASTESTASARQEKLQEKVRAMGADGARTLFIGDSEAKIMTLGQGPEAMNLVENRTFGVQEVARALGLDPALLGDKSQGAFSTTEAAATHFVRFTLRTWAQRISLALTNSLFPGHRRWVRFDLDAAKRGEVIERIRANAAAIQTMQLTPDEARVDMGLPPQGGNAEKLWAQGALQPMDNLAEMAEKKEEQAGATHPSQAPQGENLNPQDPMGGDPGDGVEREPPR